MVRADNDVMKPEKQHQYMRVNETLDKGNNEMNRAANWSVPIEQPQCFPFMFYFVEHLQCKTIIVFMQISVICRPTELSVSHLSFLSTCSPSNSCSLSLNRFCWTRKDEASMKCAQLHGRWMVDQMLP